MQRLTFFLLFLCHVMSLTSQSVTMTPKDQPFVTYGFSDPSPVMPLGRFYPYHRFDGFSMQGESKNWKAIDMENGLIQLRILPEIGGKIWGAFHKKSGFPFIYHNDVVKFRDVAARGPWTSGGVEFNFGDYGHAPSCATPVDYTLRTNADSSISCFLGAYDWSSRTHWTVEVQLSAKQTFFTSRSTWANNTPFAVSNYQWMNAGFRASDDLQFLYPGTEYIDHDGKPFSWPMHENGKNLEYYRENNFGGYKSYHVLGKSTDYFGGYWKNPDVGFIHYSPYYQKMGKKLWIWGLSRQGMIWENLLTDKNGQYVELQSGRFFNQAGPASIQSPFKYNLLMPLQTDAWDEKWMTFSGLHGHSHAFDQGVLYFSKDSVRIFFHQPFSGSIKCVDSLGISFSANANVGAGTVTSLGATKNPVLKVFLNHELVYDQSDSKIVQRPLENDRSFAWDSEYGRYLKARSLFAQRDMPGAAAVLDTLLKINPNHVDALVLLASVQIQQNLPEAKTLLRKALSINTYDGWANFYWGYLHFSEGDFTNAEDGFSVAASQQETKQLALNYLALTAFRLGFHGKAENIAKECLSFFPKTADCQSLMLVLARGKADHKSRLDQQLKENPLDPIALAEQWLVYKNNQLQKVWVNEMPHQNYIETALWYARLGLWKEAVTILEIAPENLMSSLWLAYFQKKTGAEFQTTLQKAAYMDNQLAFPFRTEEFALLGWVDQVSDLPLWDYLLAKLQWSKGLTDQAKQSFLRTGHSSDAHFYLNKALLWKGSKDSVHASLETAFRLEPDNWRVVKAWTQFLLRNQLSEEALEVISHFQKSHPANYITGQVLAEAMFANRQFRKTADYLLTFQSLPNEGASGLQQLFREACLFAALENLKSKGKKSETKKYISLADTYPENLGSGKPYDHDFSLTTYLNQLLYGADTTSPWPASSGISSFSEYSFLTEVKSREAFIANQFYQAATSGK
ncbi:MAG: DUF5107 domain-containing protein [Saprospiraceae bacterium]|nr:DUF5107 domain-containing protein [Saprospiraceae bacterium]